MVTVVIVVIVFSIRSLPVISRLDIVTSSRVEYCSPIGQEHAVPVHLPYRHGFFKIENKII